jgi:hypothetical protein
MRLLAVVLGLVLAPAAALAQVAPAAQPSPGASAPAVGAPLAPDDPCTTLSAIVNRPTVTNAVCTVRPGHTEIEGGYQNISFEGSGNQVTYPQLFVRVGVPSVPRLETIVVLPQTQRTSTGSPPTVGATDLAGGVKYLIGFSSRFSWSAQILYSAPTGSAQVSAGAITSIYSAQGSYSLSPVISLAGGLQDQILAVGGRIYGSFVPSLVVSAAVSPGTSAFAEVATFTQALGAGTATRTQYLFGLSHAVGQRLQLDASYGFSPTAASGRYRTVGAGFGFYF